MRLEIQMKAHLEDYTDAVGWVSGSAVDKE